MPSSPIAPQISGALRHSRARLYRSARTAHLERVAELPPALFLYSTRRYDFDEALAERVGAVRAGTIAAARILARSGISTLEVNEPSALESASRTAFVLAWLRVRSAFTRQRPRVVTYAIDNVDPFDAPRGSSLRQRSRRRIDLLLARYVWWECDRIAFGTSAAAQAYGRAYGRHRRRPLATTIVPALPVACPCADDAGVRPRRVVFLGALVARKGFPLIAQAWPLVLATHSDAELVIVGKGELEPLAQDLAVLPSVRLVVDPPRDRIHAELRRSAVLALPSQRSGRWREQVGLPIVEGLAHGNTIVTTDETGMAEWLATHGHVVLAADGDVPSLAEALVAALACGRSADDVRADLPAVDGRLAADGWMFAD